MDSNFEKSETYKVMYDEYWKRLRDGFMKNTEKAHEPTLDELTDMCLKSVETELKKPRKMVLITGKTGYIQYLELLYKRELTQEEKNEIPDAHFKIVV